MQDAQRGGHGRLDLSRIFTSSNRVAPVEATNLVTEALAAKLADTLALARKDLDTTAPMLGLGIDSLVAVEVRNWLTKEVRTEVAISDILGGLSVEELTWLAIERSAWWGK